MNRYENEYVSRIPELIKGSKLTRKELGVKYNGSSVSSLYRWVEGGWPPLDILLIMAKEENTNISYLLGITDVDHPLETYEPNLDLKGKMREANIKAPAIAEYVGTSARIIREYVDKPRYTRINTLVGMALAMNVSLDYLLGLTPVKRWELLLLKPGIPAYIYKDRECSGKVKSKTESVETFCLLHLDGERVILPSGDVINMNDSIFENAIIIPLPDVPDKENYITPCKTATKEEKAKK